MARPPLEVADLIRAAGDAYEEPAGKACQLWHLKCTCNISRLKMPTFVSLRKRYA